MSLILEALRKSEAERRRGQVPTLHAERAPAAQPARAARPSWPWLALAIPVVLATAWLARGAWSPPRAVGFSPDPVAQSALANAGATEPFAPDTGVGSHGAAAARQVAATARTPVDPPILTSTPPSPSAANAATNAARESTALAPPRNDASATPARIAAAVAASLGPQMPAASVAPPPRTTAPMPAMPSAVTPPAPIPAPTATATATAAAVAAPLRLSDLSVAERLELPPLKMSMHMWGATRAQRFAIIDGARVNEGDRLGEAVVDEITASAVVLAWRGQRLQIPLR